MAAKNTIISSLGSSEFKIATGVQTTLSASDTVVTGLKKVISVTASLVTDPAASNTTGVTVTASIATNGKDIVLKTWDGSQVAVTHFSAKVAWIAIGY